MNQLCRPSSCLLAAALMVAAVGCKDDTIRNYQIPKEKPKVVQQQTPGVGPVHLHWESLPEGWMEQPLSPMRAASFRIQGGDDQEADVAAIPVPELGDNKLAVINMWREGMGLATIEEQQIDEVREPVTVSGLPGHLFDMVTTVPPEGQKVNQRTLVAMASRGDNTWFFKLAGPDELVGTHKENFIAFVRDVEFHEGSHDEAAPAMAAAPAPARTAAGLPTWSVPAEWQQTAPGMMTLASFDLPGGGAKVTVSSLGGDGGGLLMNINRWRSQQMGLTPATPDDLATMVTTAKSTVGEASVVDFENETQRLIAVIVPHAGSTWFYKAMGDPATVGRAKDAFVKFALTAQY